MYVAVTRNTPCRIINACNDRNMTFCPQYIWLTELLNPIRLQCHRGFTCNAITGYTCRSLPYKSCYRWAFKFAIIP